VTEEHVYIDRGSGKRVHEEIYASRFLYWASNAMPGRWFSRLVLSRLWPSRLYAWWKAQPRSRREIAPFVARMGIDMTESLRPVEDFRSFADFFTREIDLSRRPLPERTDACVSPADGKLLVYPEIHAQPFRIKSHMFELRSFLRDDDAWEACRGGSMAVLRLGLADYHHFHFPCAGMPGAPRLLQGRCYIGGPYAVKSWMPFYRENVRSFTRIESEYFGPVLMAEIGSFAVASIHQAYASGTSVAIGTHKGHFALGASTIVLLFPPGVMRFDEDLVRRSAEGMESRVLMGERIGVPAEGKEIVTETHAGEVDG
jgi:phosphatidylserine decarboxylase